ncbi:2-dehydro-3-deoxy-6-phosphogalactonate aldolase [Undibacterium fentianense]|uniref:2-dehydro-3-deoxy-6-phosphogalactonate aldolase n=1 Tax=Undibacterium fentianense TaxID=2828728 RepID=A0A941E4K3_9BURK|nr:2-dehydro-3-deoxy-6-phosphogalactonate aldolase [Undibacterium fentianense]MBR7801067.1 2-dehydro-3-deoxy-6-phosphogalactonate aldolase [Undibacterium fentianense]
MKSLSSYMSSLPLLAILRGVQTSECLAIADALVDAGFRCIEIPLNSPQAMKSIELLAKHFPDDVLFGAGTVMTETQVEQVYQSGGRLIVMPHTDIGVIGAAKRRGMICAPGVATLTEAFSALEAGADALKLFPSESVPPAVLRAWRTVLPPDALCLPVGGVKPEDMAAYIDAGASGFGLGSNLYRPGNSSESVSNNAHGYIAALKAIRSLK